MAEPKKLVLDAETMRSMGYRVVDALVDREAALEDGPAWQGATRASLEALLREPPPSDAQPFESILHQLIDDVLPWRARVDHPRFLAFVPGSPTWPGVLADFIASGFNVFQGSWIGGSGASEVELIVLDWFKDWIGYPAEAAGLFLSGGSAANLTALACARLHRTGPHDPASVIYTSIEAHSSTMRAARILGFADDRVRRLPTNGQQRIDTQKLAAAIAADRDAGLEPLAVTANAGATSTGAIDPLEEIAAICAECGVWLHVDAAYGGFAVLTDRGRASMRGIERADSITLDPHKWLFQPFEAGCLLVRDGKRLDQAFQTSAGYLQDAQIAEAPLHERPVNFMDRGIQLTRSARSLKVWTSLKYYGIGPFRDAIDLALDLAVHAQKRIEGSPVLELLTPATLGIVCFRRVTGPAGERLAEDRTIEDWNARIVRALANDGTALMSSTRVNGTYALRICILSHRTRQADVDRVIDWIENATPEL